MSGIIRWVIIGAIALGFIIFAASCASCFSCGGGCGGSNLLSCYADVGENPISNIKNKIIGV